MTPEERAAALAELDRLERAAIRDAEAYGGDIQQHRRSAAVVRKALEETAYSKALRKAREDETAAWEAYADASQDDLGAAYVAAYDASRVRAALEHQIMNATLA